MATTLPPTQTKKYVDFDEFIDFQLQKTRSNIKATDILTALAGVAVLFLAYLLAFVLLDHWVIPGGFGAVGRWVMLGGLVAATGAWLVWKVAVPYLRSVTRLYAARAIEITEPELKSSLLNLIDLERAGRPVPEHIRTAIEKRAAVTLARTDIERAVDRRPLLRLSYALLALVVLACLYTLFSQKKITSSVWRAFFPAAAVAAPTEIEILDVKPGDVEVLARSKVEVTVDLAHSGEPPESVTLFYTTKDRKFRDVPVEMRAVADHDKRYRAVVGGEYGRGILQDTTYRIAAGDARSADYAIHVSQPPIANVNEVRYEYPEYMELRDRTQAGGHIDAWEGTKVTVTATANMPVNSAKLVFLNSDDPQDEAGERMMEIADGTKLSATLDREMGFRKDGTYPHFYRIECRNEKRETDPDPVVYGLTIRRDLPPEIDLIDPSPAEIEAPANAVIPLLFRARDPDFKLKYVTLRTETTRGDAAPGAEPRTGSESLFEGSRKTVQRTHEWKLEPLGLKPGDTIRARIEVRDNKPPVGNRTFSRPLTVRIIKPVPPEEVEKQLQHDRQRQKDMADPSDADPNEADRGEQQPGEGDDGGEPKDKGEEGAGEPQPGDKGKTNKKDAGKAPAGQEGDEPKPDPDAEPSGEPKEGGSEAGDRPIDPKSPEGQELLRQLAERAAKEQEDQGDASDQPNDQKDGPPDGPQKRPDAGSEPDDNKTPEGKSESGGQKRKSNPGAQQDETPEGSQQPGKEPDGDPDSKQPRGAKENDPNRKTGGEKSAPSDGQDPNAKDGRNPDGSRGDPDSDPAGGEPKGTGGEPTKGKNDRDKKDPSKPQTGEKAKDPKSPPEGDEQPSDPSNDAARRKADGTEKGTGDPDKDPDADPTQANDPDKVQRREGTEPAKKPRTGRKSPSDPNSTKEATDNPGAADPAPPMGKDKQPNPDQRTTDPKDTRKERRSAEKDVPNQPGNTDLKGEGRPKGQDASEPDGGEAGSGRQSDQGNKGSNDPGPGDTGRKPGGADKSDGSKTGKSGDEQGPGSKQQPGSKDGGKAPAGKKGSKDGSDKGGSDNTGSKSGSPMKGSDGMGDSGEGSKPGEQPGQGGDQPGGGKQPGDAQDFPSGTGTGPQGEAPGKGAATDDSPPQAPPEPDKEALDYGKKAADLVLKRLERELERGEVDQDWLKKHGWSENDLRRFAKDLRQNLDQLESDDQSPQSQAERMQFEEVLKSLKFQSELGPRRGENVRKDDLNVGSRRLPVPAEYREAYEAFTRSVHQRRKKEER